MTTGVLLLHGSSGTPDLERVRIIEAEGYDVLAPQWFDGTISEIPLESFPVDELAARNDRVAVMGTSRGKRYGADAARIPVERFTGEILMVAGGDDRVWPSVEFAERIALARSDLPTRTVVAARAGHRVIFPGETPKTSGQRMARGGTEEADRELGALAWADVRRVLAG